MVPIIKLKKERFLRLFFICLLALLLFLIACLFLLNHLNKLQIKSADNRFNSHLLATGLKQSSDDLTKMVRLYVVTGEKKYRDYYDEIIGIREGTSPRPVCYSQIYWDLVVDSKRPCPYGEKESRNQMMLNADFTLDEFDLLKESLSLSNALVAMETKAMNALEGKFEDSTGLYTITGKPDPEHARKLVFSNEYMNLKAQIMEPLQSFFEHIDSRTKSTNERLQNEVNWLIITAIGLSIFTTLLMAYSIFKALKSLSTATKESELLLLNILPETIADRLKGGEKTIADEFSQASILFTDIVGFTSMTYQIGAAKVVTILNDLFEKFDELTEKYGVEKVKTIGDSYMVVSGVPVPSSDHAIRLANFALAAKEKIAEFNKENKLHLEMRMGMTFGTVIAGVIGHKKFIYDVWGDVVNIASRMESTSLPGEIQVTEKMAFMLNDDFDLVGRDEIQVKGMGEMKTYFLKGVKKNRV